MIPTSRPLLPRAADIHPYLVEIDANRWYSNFGHLVKQFEGCLAKHFGCEPGTVVTTASGTTALTLAIHEAADAPGICLMPAWTFAATPLAAMHAGLTPYFIDVDPVSWQPSVTTVEAALARLGDAVRAIVIVSPFGETVDDVMWAAFAQAHRVPIIIDAAAGFDSVRPGCRLPAVVSLHATKAFGVGEGGVILAGSIEQADRVRRLSNFGFDPSRRSTRLGWNAKMSEYAAAVGLAAFVDWPTKRARILETATDLEVALDAAGPVATRWGGHAGSTFNILSHPGKADAAIADLRRCDLEARKWWGDGCHRHPCFEAFGHDGLAETDKLAAQVLAIPFFADMTSSEIARVAEAVGGSPSVCERRRLRAWA